MNQDDVDLLTKHQKLKKNLIYNIYKIKLRKKNLINN